ncbi:MULTISPECIES: FAD-dependent oxidoreductase [Catenuloplanes]|uniref:2-polyprenyl-6-methoxyphenol hydroxylase-like FAD-dependent oxidoreductase n=1 Tax=Catenuloplanes niger TaxID=587534 RepID=A0AAE3ZZL1_9ACTN|nr:FAD-dependent oxidoreductase [Catenuloplanes niger]MDR7327932.1 2-polyprenyl-6-methoxyphenol hydroxylase-like FAD-dependent oxidoreductase [Catenuloplanes niger]
MEFHDVIVVGAGPNGLMAAAELALAGVRPLVLERDHAPREEMRANGMVGQIVRLLDRRGLLSRLTGDAAPPRPADHFMFAAFPMPFHRLPDNPVHTVLVPQRRVEQVLAERAAELGVRVVRGRAVTALSQDADGVTVTTADGTVHACSWLIGADGGRSTVRKLAGIGFPGITHDRTVSRSVHVRLAPDALDPDTRALRVPGFGEIPPFLHTRLDRGMVSFAPFPDGRVMVNVSEVGADAGPSPDGGPPMTAEEFRAAFTRVVGVPGPFPEVTPVRRLTGGNTRLADRYRAGRVFLVGDAAHVHSAIGGNGLNLGLQDAVNLSWKVAAAVHGWAPPALLDTYESERRPAGARVTMQTTAQGVLVGPGPEITALRTLVGELLQDPPALARIAALISGADVAYPHTTRWAPDLTVDGRPLSEFTGTGRPLLIDTTPDRRHARVAAGWAGRVTVVAGAGDASMLIRPDGYVAWEDGDGLGAALTRWFGEPVHSHGSSSAGSATVSRT